MSVSLKRSLLRKAYPLPKSTFVQISNILITEYRKRTIPLYKDVRTNDLDDGALQDFREDRNPPLCVSYSVISDGIQQVLTESEFDRISEIFNYERCAVCVNLNCGNALLHFDAHLDGRLSIHLQDCTTFTKVQAKVFLWSLSRAIRAELKHLRKKPDKVVSDNTKPKNGGHYSTRIHGINRIIWTALKWIFDKLIDIGISFLFRMFILFPFFSLLLVWMESFI